MNRKRVVQVVALVVLAALAPLRTHGLHMHLHAHEEHDADGGHDDHEAEALQPGAHAGDHEHSDHQLAVPLLPVPLSPSAEPGGCCVSTNVPPALRQNQEVRPHLVSGVDGSVEATWIPTPFQQRLLVLHTPDRPAWPPPLVTSKRLRI